MLQSMGLQRVGHNLAIEQHNFVEVRINEIMLSSNFIIAP